MQYLALHYEHRPTLPTCLPGSIVQLEVPLELLAGQELLQLQGDVHGEGDDVVVQHHPQQEHLQDPGEGDVVNLVQVPDALVLNVRCDGITARHLVAQDGGKVVPVVGPSDVGHVEKDVLIGTEEMENFGQAEQVQVRPLLKLVVEHEGEDRGDDHLCQQDGHEEHEVLVEGFLQGRKLVLCNFRVERNLGLSTGVDTASEDLLCVLENGPGQQQVVVGQGARLE